MGFSLTKTLQLLGDLHFRKAPVFGPQLQIFPTRGSFPLAVGGSETGQDPAVRSGRVRHMSGQGGHAKGRAAKRPDDHAKSSATDPIFQW